MSCGDFIERDWMHKMIIRKSEQYEQDKDSELILGKSFSEYAMDDYKLVILDLYSLLFDNHSRFTNSRNSTNICIEIIDEFIDSISYENLVIISPYQYTRNSYYKLRLYSTKYPEYDDISAFSPLISEIYSILSNRYENSPNIMITKMTEKYMPGELCLRFIFEYFSRPNIDKRQKTLVYTRDPDVFNAYIRLIRRGPVRQARSKVYVTFDNLIFDISHLTTLYKYIKLDSSNIDIMFLLFGNMILPSYYKIRLAAANSNDNIDDFMISYFDIILEFLSSEKITSSRIVDIDTITDKYINRNITNQDLEKYKLYMRVPSVDNQFGEINRMKLALSNDFTRSELTESDFIDSELSDIPGFQMLQYMYINIKSYYSISDKTKVNTNIYYDYEFFDIAVSFKDYLISEIMNNNQIIMDKIIDSRDIYNHLEFIMRTKSRNSFMHIFENQDENLRRIINNRDILSLIRRKQDRISFGCLFPDFDHVNISGFRSLTDPIRVKVNIKQLNIYNILVPDRILFLYLFMSDKYR